MTQKDSYKLGSDRERRRGLSIEDFMQIPYESVISVRGIIRGDTTNSEYHFAFFFQEKPLFGFHPDGTGKSVSEEAKTIASGFERILGMKIGGHLKGSAGAFDETPSQEQVAEYLNEIFQTYELFFDPPTVTVDVRTSNE